MELKHGLLKTGLLRGNRIAINRSKVSRRTICHLRPNFQHKTFFSIILNSRIRLIVTARDIKTIDKYNGFIDSAVLSVKSKNLAINKKLQIFRKKVENKCLEYLKDGINLEVLGISNCAVQRLKKIHNSSNRG